MIVLSLVVALSTAQVVPEREVAIIQSLYDAGKYAEAAKRANESMSLTNFSDPQRLRLHELTALSEFNLGNGKAAAASFLQLLKLNPDYVLDPFAVPPPAIKLFEQVKKDNVDALNLVRQQIAIRADQEKRADEDRKRLEEEQERRRKEQALLTQEITVRTIEKHPLLLNFLPFGAGQFSQQRIGWGVAFAVTEGITAVLSIVSFFAIESLYEDVTMTWSDRLTADGKPFSITVRSIPTSRHTERDVWTGMKFGTGAAFYVLWAAGIAEALFHYEDETVTETKVPAQPLPAASFKVFPTNGGMGAGVSVRF